MLWRYQGIRPLFPQVQSREGDQHPSIPAGWSPRLSVVTLASLLNRWAPFTKPQLMCITTAQHWQGQKYLPSLTCPWTSRVSGTSSWLSQTLPIICFSLVFVGFSQPCASWLPSCFQHHIAGSSARDQEYQDEQTRKPWLTSWDVPGWGMLGANAWMQEGLGWVAKKTCTAKGGKWVRGMLIEISAGQALPCPEWMDMICIFKPV